MTTNLGAEMQLGPTWTKAAKRRYTAPRLTVHGTVAALATATGVDGLLASRPGGF